MDKNQPGSSNQSSGDQSSRNQTEKQGSDLPGTSKDPTGRVISDKPSQGENRQDQDSPRSTPSYREPDSDNRKGS